MITESWPRLVIGTILLFVGAATGLVAWSVETCAEPVANSLWTGAVALAANLLAWILLGRRVPSKLVLFVAFLPALAAILYTGSTVDLTLGYLFDGQGACALLTADSELGPDGREPFYIILWLLVCASFWGGLAPVVKRAISVWKESRA